MAEADGESYFFLYPAGHLGLTAVTFFESLPFKQVMVVFFIAPALASAASFAAVALIGERTATVSIR